MCECEDYCICEFYDDVESGDLILFIQYLCGTMYTKKVLAKYKKGGKTKSRVNESGNYTKPGLRKRLFQTIMRGTKGGRAGQWSARKAQLLAKRYRAAGGGYKN